ncbi:hypothetical protein [Polynucleobacter sp. JS-JIR-5-A7]|uniref:hypothetical protein n=1 Tax=Polynucleobacter sp. JS-JIR-5-A7 TaxID=1758395 RepID=UPI001BFD21F5|nr:hypothetical protein [Polynucleobacter sp. JS-JIR-5-A7]QWE06061.1 hypothetical protein AOC29_08040 [Polynucleobacter sp. JS-JIR-5-A7]
MNTKLTQKEVVDLFNQEMARHQQAMVMAELKYQEALITFATENLGVTEQEWTNNVSERMMDLVAVDYIVEAIADNVTDNLPHHYLAHEYALRHEISNIGDGEQWFNLNVTA